MRIRHIQSILHTQNIERSSDAVSPIERYCSYVEHDHYNLMHTRTWTIVFSALMYKLPLCHALPPSFVRKMFPTFYDFVNLYFFPVPVIANKFGLATSIQLFRPLRPAHFRARSKYGVYLTASFYPPAFCGGTLLLGSRPLLV